MSNKNISAALLNVQKKLEAVSKSADNPYFSSKYADLNTIISATKPLLNEQGVVMLQLTGRDSLGDYVETELTHVASGEVKSSRMYLTTNSGQDMQKFGAAVTYARRYGLQSLLTMEAEDDDGETAVGRGKTSTRASAPRSSSGSSYTARSATKTSSSVAETTPASANSASPSSAVSSTTSLPPGSVQTKTSSFKKPSAFKNGSTTNGKGVF